MLAGCAAEVAFIADPGFAAGMPSRDAFDSSFVAYWRTIARRAEVVWPETATLDGGAIDAMVASTSADTVVLSPYASLFVADLASAYPARRFVAFTVEAPALDNVRVIRFDATQAASEAGAWSAEWLFAGTGRSVVLFGVENPEHLRAESASFVDAYVNSGGVGLDEHWFVDAPTRDQVRSRVREITGVRRARDAGETLLVLMLGNATSRALEAVRDSDFLLGVRGSWLNPDDPRLVFVIRDDPISALTVLTTIASDQAGALVAASVFEASAVR
ncbi:MAG: hypothetical protein EA382_02900 [Spirochaetaceae bacterium]|nr:MAG: hypothetical protein EA382_02900 [Spirochaetaceae bacterium]